MSWDESDAYDAGDPKAPGYVHRLVDDADNYRTARKAEPCTQCRGLDGSHKMDCGERR